MATIADVQAPFAMAPNPVMRADDQFRFYVQSSENMRQCMDDSVALTVTSPPYWNSIDYDVHTGNGSDDWYRERNYSVYGSTYEDYLDRIEATFNEVKRVTMPGGFCAIVIGTILQKGKHYPAPFNITDRLVRTGWLFHQDIIWNKVTAGIRRAGSFIQRPQAGYYYPNIMTEYILVFRKEGSPRRDTNQALPIDDLFTRDIANNVWHIAPVPPNTIDHPCPYPEELVRRLILLYSQKGDEVLDPFLGSGQTAKVAVQHGRRAVGYDIEPKYVRLAESRLYEPTKRRYNLVPKVLKIEATHALQR